MRKVIAVLFALTAVVAFSTPVFAERTKSKSSQAPQRQRSHEECHSLALQRGLNVSRYDRWQLDSFIAGCRSGKIR
jgi:hypothetical protein